MMQPPSPSTWPSEPGELARLANDPRTDAAARGRALNDLRPRIDELARRVARGFKGQTQQDVLDEAVTVVGMALGQFDPDRGTTFDGWAYTILYNHGAGLRRRAGSRDLLNQCRTGAAGNQPRMLTILSHPAGVPATNEGVENWRAGLRRALDRLAVAGPSTGINYHAVFLLQARLRLAASARSSFRKQEAPPGEIAQLAIWLCEWRPAEEALALRVGAPTIGDTWKALAPLTDQPNRPSAADIARALASLACSPPVNASLWCQWAHRSRAWASQQVGPEVWSESFEAWA